MFYFLQSIIREHIICYLLSNILILLLFILLRKLKTKKKQLIKHLNALNRHKFLAYEILSK